MFAILFSEENLGKILEHNETVDSAPVYPDVYLNHKNDWYYIRGYVTNRGKVVDYAVIPEYLFVKVFDYNPEKIKTDWDIIVRHQGATMPSYM